MTPLVMRAHRRPTHRRVQALGVRPEPADHVRELVRARRRRASVADRATSSTVVNRQRACRAFSDAPVSRRRHRAASSNAATYAPSAENRQPWEFVVVRDAGARAAIGDLTRRAWEAHGRAFSETRLEPKLLADVDARRDRRHRGRARAHRRVRRHRARPRGDGPVVDLPGGAEPAARRDRARARERAHDDHHRLPRRARRAARPPGARRAGRGRPDRPPGEAARAARAASRSTTTRTASNTDRRGSGDAQDRDRSARAPALGRRRGDLDAWAAICADPEVMRYIGDGSIADPSRMRGAARAVRDDVARARLRAVRDRAPRHRRVHRQHRPRGPRLPSRDTARRSRSAGGSGAPALGPRLRDRSGTRRARVRAWSP